MYDKTAKKSELTTTPTIQTAADIKQETTRKLDKLLSYQSNIAAQADKLGLDLNTLGMEVSETIEHDKATMSDWLKKYEQAIKLAKLQPQTLTKNFPFEKASNLVTPYILQAAIDFNARTSPIFIERQDICKAKIVGKERTIQFIVDPNTGQEQEVNQEQIQQIQQAQQRQQQQAQAMQAQGMEAPQQKEIPQVQSRLSTEKQDMADRVCKAVNYDLTTGIENWRELKDKELFLLPIVGTTFKLNRQCPFENKRITTLISPELMICDHTKDSFFEVMDKSFEYNMHKNDVITAIETGQFIEIDLEHYKEEDQIEFYESHTWLDLDDDGFKEPYIVTIEAYNNTVVSIVPRYDFDDIWLSEGGDVVKIKAEEPFTCTIFMPDPCGGFMGFGWGILLGSMFEAITSIMNQLIDAGTLKNVGSNSGFIRSGGAIGPRAGNRQRKGEVNMTLGKFTTIESDGTSPLDNDIVNFPFAGPDPVLFQLMEFVVNNIQQMTTAGSIEVQANEAADMYLARLRESMISTNSIRIRVAQGMTREIDRIVDLQRKYLGQDEYADILDDEAADWTQDYSATRFNIAFTADPTQGSEQERIARSRMILEEAKQAQGALDLRVAYENYFESVGVHDSEELDKILPPPQPNEPDPIEMMRVQSMQTMSQAEMIKGQADMESAAASKMKAQVDMLEAQIKFSKMKAEIDKMQAETVQALSTVQDNEVKLALEKQKEMNKQHLEQAKILQQGLDNGRAHNRQDRSEEREERQLINQA